MVTLHEGKQYILNNERISSKEEAQKLSEEDGRKQTLTYQIMEAHNHSGNMEHLQIQFDSWVSTITPMWAFYRPHMPVV